MLKHIPKKTRDSLENGVVIHRWS